MAAIQSTIEEEEIVLIDSLEIESIVEVSKEEPKPEEVVLGMGKTLRLLSLEKYGHREFWIYIYLDNKNKIENPNNVPVGTKLVIPPKEKYGINANSPASVRRATERGAKELNKVG